ISMKSAKAFPPAVFTRGPLAGLTSITEYTLKSALSPSTSVLSATRLLKARYVPRSVSVYARRSSAMPSVPPMPCPDSMYQGAAAEAVPGRDVRGRGGRRSGLLPQRLLEDVRAGLAAARHEARARRGDFRQRGGSTGLAADLGGIGLGPDDDEVVVHHQAAVQELALRDVLLLQRGRVHQHDVSFTACGERQRLPGADRHGLYRQTALLFEERNQHIE